MKKTLTTLTFLLFGLIAFGQIKYGNILKNPNGDNALDSWTIDENGGDGWSTRGSGDSGTTYFVNSYTTCTKSQTINLLDLYTGEELDAQPIITYSEYYIGISSGSTSEDDYFLNVYLLDEDMYEITSFLSGTLKSSNQWQQIHGYLSNYGEGVRHIKFEHGGRGNNGWAGHYGSAMKASYLSVGNPIIYTSGYDANSLVGWDIDENGGDGWRVAASAYGNLFQTSYNTCIKSQTLDLLAMGYTATELDNQPRISCFEFTLGYSNGGTVADAYTMNIELLDANMNIIYSVDSTLTCTAEWQQMQLVLEKYGEGVRYIKYSHGGQDADGWAGHYGSLMDRATILLGEATKEQTSSIATNRLSTNISVYPNPATNNLTLATSQITVTVDTRVTILDLQGRVLRSLPLLGINTLDVSDIAPGAYYISIVDQAQGTNATTRFLKN